MRVVRMINEASQAGLFQVDVVAVAEIIEADDFVSALQQAQGNVGADKAGRASDQNLHSQIITDQRRPSTASRGRTYLTSYKMDSGLP